MSKEVDIALLEQYLAREIEGSQVCYMDGTPLTKEALEAAVRDYEQVLLQIEGAGLKEHLQTMHEELVPKREKTYRRLISMAAAVLLIGVFGTLIWQRVNRAPEFSDYFNHFDQLVTYRDSDSTDYSAGLEAYTLREYDKAYNLLTSVDSLNNELKFYQAVSALGSQRFEEAITLFEFLGTNSENKYYQQTKWYLGLAYWQVGKTERAIKLLKEITTGLYKDNEALKLLKKLEE